jgi:methyl-accepting chemotaxis protein
MKIKLKLSAMMIAIVVAVAGSIAVLQLRQASGISLEMSKRGVTYLSRQRAEYWKGLLNGYIQVLRTAAAVMSDYEDLPAPERRDRYDQMLLSIMQAQSEFVRVFTVWKPGVLDGMDSSYIGRTGSGPQGQYAMSYSRETGQITGTSSLSIADSMAHVSSPNARKDWVDHPMPFTVSGKGVYAVRMMVPITNFNTGEIVGTVGCMLDTGVCQPILENSIKAFEEMTAVSIYSGNGFIIASFKPERIGEMLIDAEIQYGDLKIEASEAVLAGKEFECYSYAPLLKTNLQIFLTSFNIGNSDTTWSIMVGSSERFIMKDVNAMTRFTVILAAIAISAAMIIVYLALGSVTRPIVKVAGILRNVAKGDLTQTINVNTKDELGDLSNDLNVTLENIKNMIGGIKKQASNLNDIGSALASNMNETAASVSQITANIRNIKSRVMNQSASVSETHATMEQVVGNIGKLNGHVEDQSSNMSQASSAIEQMVASIHSVTETLVNNTDNVKTLMESSEVGRNGLSEVAQDIQEIARESAGLLEINSLMENIASQTNLLSMNAAIEAAHAGEAGKGFAVVADEIRKLAENSGEQSKTIGTVLKKITDSIDKITGATENVLTKFGAIDTSVKTVAEQEENIRSAMEEQGEGSKQVLDGVSHVNEITRQVMSGSQEMLEGSREVIKESNNLEKVTQEITGGMNEMASGADEIIVAVNHVNELCGRNRESIGVLLEEVARFKVA